MTVNLKRQSMKIIIKIRRAANENKRRSNADGKSVHQPCRNDHSRGTKRDKEMIKYQVIKNSFPAKQK